MRTALALAALPALLARVVADFNITLSDVPDSTRSSWCSAQLSACTTLCSGTLNNTCDPTSLAYNCTCSNGSAPGLQYYENTMPWYKCEEAYSECVDNNPNNLSGQQGCKTNIQDQCGTLNLSDANVASPSSSASSSSATGSPTANSAGAKTTTKSGAATLEQARYLGNGVALLATVAFAAALL